MPTTKQRVESGKRNYAGSDIEKRNQALHLAALYQPLRAVDPLAKPFLALSRITSVLDYCTDTDKSKVQINQGREPYLMVQDTMNPGDWLSVAIYDRRTEAIEKRSGMCWIDLHKGECLVKPDTLVYWK